ncbi:MAG: Tn3 family transposase [Tatlockia sp.]|nr:Tn3 family transposase [Tatlockia sp.]
MIYWHVDTKSMVVHSQIKTCLSSEVGAMITGVLRHDTKMNMNKAYPDTHGQEYPPISYPDLLYYYSLH